MRTQILITYLLLVFSLPYNAQPASRITIEGKITDERTGMPLELVNIFLENTTIGTTSDSDGKFIISDIPFGSYKIVFSYIGYVTVTKSFYSYKPERINYHVSLKLKVIDLNEINVVGVAPGEWEKNLEVFKKIFLGETENSSKTEIINPWVLNLTRDSNSKILKAYADSVLKIENKALGYCIYIHLDSLLYIPDGYIKYYIYPRFEEMPAVSEKEKKERENNRQKSYTGSLRHFLYALVHKQLEEDNFYLNELPANKLLIGISTRISPEDLLITSTDSTIYTLNYKGRLEVRYSFNSSSYIDFLYPFSQIDKYGNLLTSQHTIEISGYWGKQRIADLLPLDYVYRGE